MDFYRIIIVEKKDGTLQVRPDWKVGKSSDLMTRGGSFYAIWDEAQGLWSTEIYDVQRLVDAELIAFAKDMEAKTGQHHPVAKLESNNTKLWDGFRTFLRNSGDNFHNLDEKLIFADTNVKKEDYASRRLSYSLSTSPCPSWDSMVGTLYNEEERAKIEWAIGAVVSGDSKFIQKFLVFYGPPGSGKSTIMNVIQKLFDGYCSIFDARELAGNNNTFATAAFKSNPLVAVQHDGDLSRIYDNTKLNSIVAHEIMTVNEKYKAPYPARSNAFLFMGTNTPVKISDAKSGIIRRLIDVVPTQKTIEHDAYHDLMTRIDFELGAIAQHCLDKYKAMGKNYYSAYRPTTMMLQTDVFFNFVEANYDIFKNEDAVTLKRAWALYKDYCSETGIEKFLPQYKFREELKNYFFVFEERAKVDGITARSVYRGFKFNETMLPQPEFPVKPAGLYEIVLTEGKSIFDEKFQSCPAQYAKEDETPARPWDGVTTTLADIDTSKMHYVRIPENHIIVDFDLVNAEGEKDLSLNLSEASKWPATYAELSKSGKAVHLHYDYAGDVSELASYYADGIEVKTLLGKASLRRKLTKCNDINVTPLEGGLPKKEKPLINNNVIRTEQGLRQLLVRCLRKEIHPGTKSNIDFIKKILDEAYASDMAYDVSDMRSDILTFAFQSTNNSEYCIKKVQEMSFASENEIETSDDEEAPLVIFDVEVYPNLFVVCWKYHGSDEVVRMINPSAVDIEPLFDMRLVGFNNRRYDNHILYARYIGYSNEGLHALSQKLVDNSAKDAYFAEAYNLSYTDIFDFCSKKQSLKKWEIELGLFHMELDLPWDEPVPEELWPLVVDYCVNDVLGTEGTFNARAEDFTARKILADLSGLSVNHTTQAHTAKIIFGDNKRPQDQFVYTDLSKLFPGYYYGSGINPDTGKETWGSYYRGELVGEGGYVYAEPGIYENVALLDVASMHPTSIEELDVFGPYTSKFSELKAARIAIKRKDYDLAKTLLNGRLDPFLRNEDGEYDMQAADNLSYALKIVINIVYGLTSAKFENPFRDNRNVDNIVAKRGALFMIDLKNEIQERGFKVAHIKTDSIKIPNATPEIIEFVTQFGEKYGYEFEHETTFQWFCLVNEAVYIARDHEGWHAVGAQFQHPYVFKTLFTQEPLEFSDFCETKSVMQGAMYLAFEDAESDHDMVHVGKTGSFVPVTNDGGILYRIKDDKKYAVTGTKGYRWINRDVAMERNAKDELNIDMAYFDKLKQEAVDAITKFDEVNGIDGFMALHGEYKQ